MIKALRPLFVLFLVIVSQVAFAAVFTSKKDGDWTDPTTWGTASAPGVNDNVTITHKVTYTSTSYTAWSAGGSIIVKDGGILYRSGSLTFVGGGVSVSMQSGGTLEVTGTLSVDQSKLTLSGGTVKGGAITIPDNNNNSGITYTSGTIQVTSTSLFVGIGATFNYSPNISLPGAVTLRNGSTLNVLSSGNMDVSGGSTLNLVSGTYTPSSIAISQANSTVRLKTGSLTYASGLTIDGGKLVVEGGALTVNNSLTVQSSGSFTMSGGTASIRSLSVSGSSFTGDGGTLTVTTNGISVNSSSSFTNNTGSTVIVNTGSNTGGVSAAQFTNSGVFQIINAGNFDFTNSGGTFSNSGTLTVGGNLTQYATFNSSGGSITVAGSFTNSGGTVTNGGTLSVGTTLTTASNFSNSGTITATTLTTGNSGGTFTNTGTTTISGAANISGSVQLSPGTSSSSRMTVRGTFNLTGSGLTVGNGTPGSPAKYADLVVEGNVAQTSHNINVKCNGRVAVFGDLTLSGGGGLQFNIENCGTSGGVPVGGQVYIDGDGTGSSVSNSSSGGAVNNNNPNFGTPSTPYGFYVNGSVSTSGGTIDSDMATVAQMQSTNPSFYTWVSTLPNSPLPVKLQYFKVASVNELGISLEWATSMEKDFSHFEVQRSGTDLEFSTIAIVEGKGGLQVKTVYESLDKQPVNGRNYYRLKAVDVDDTFEYFQVITADWSFAHGLSLYPNPAINKSFTIDIGDEFDQPASLTVCDSRGYLLFTTTVDVKTRLVELPSNTTPGIYFVRVASSGKSKVVRLVVQ
ncbi:T9SS type A sorting domain-containing protein [Chryseolinea sp. T2]|uniref:T9SS type A sorting domain-containing protein n=1 Tax=Chryseolinea sp. T2 TaxID=3129255 RepID=UPI0030776632